MSSIKIYSLRMVPPQPVYNDVVNFKDLLIRKVGKQPLSKSNPHITLGEFAMDTAYQELLVKTFDELSKIKTFHIDIEGFGIFENNSNTLYLKIPTSEAIKSIHTAMKVLWIRDLHRKLKSLKVSNTPHLTISKLKNSIMLHDSFNFFQKTDYFKKQIEIDHLVLTSRFPKKTWDWNYIIKLS
ncbi:2'-5' RNA ligase family protein [Mariniflexile gromovii]|uniref:2'-5' RNA ligase family protein n=1 Tax=Mariniflexile gromovii TaxID=362523 RepID=A0ABS4BPB0_9FLAO|nr:2'-5' RNA ligase family protein [Mariniflexile gromovii]MBP0902362.1 2'-5' RNA ligase family protein [Mariniflexile gromovii]